MWILFHSHYKIHILLHPLQDGWEMGECDSPFFSVHFGLHHSWPSMICDLCVYWSWAWLLWCLPFKSWGPVLFISVDQRCLQRYQKLEGCWESNTSLPPSLFLYLAEEQRIEGFFFSFSWIEVLEWGVWKCVGHWGGHSDIRALQIVSGQEQWLLNVL